MGDRVPRPAAELAAAGIRRAEHVLRALAARPAAQPAVRTLRRTRVDLLIRRVRPRRRVIRGVTRVRMWQARSGASGPLQSRLDAALGAAGPRCGACVVDLSSGQTIYARRPTERLPTASLQKLYTASAAMVRLGLEARFDTTLLARAVPEDGRLRGDLFLRGGGDPLLGGEGFAAELTRNGLAGARSIDDLARELVRSTRLRRLDGRVVADRSALDGYPGGLPFERRWTGELEEEDAGRDEAAMAAEELRAALSRAGVEVSGDAVVGVTAPDALPLASVSSPSLSDLVFVMNRESDSFLAELLVKQLGLRCAGQGTTPAGARVVTQAMSELGVGSVAVDGCGMSVRCQTAPADLVRLLTIVSGTPAGTALRRSLPVAGVDGTLARRMRGTPAAGRCSAKTGTLMRQSRVSNLAGWCETRDGRTFVFALMLVEIDFNAAHLLQDRIVADIAGARAADLMPQHSAHPPGPSVIPAP